MSLEDHLGDILRKARMMQGAPIEDAARAAGLAPADLESLESTGLVGKRPDFQALGQFLNLRPACLESVAAGWLPQPPDLSRWREFRQISTSDGMEVHSYLVWDEVTREAALFDTGFDAAPVFALIQTNGLHLRHLFITHSHGDHVAALETIQERTTRLAIHTHSKTAPVQHRNRPDECVQLGSLRISHRDTPGHADDGVTYLVGNWPDDAPHVAVVGDAIFAGSMGGAPRLGELARRKVRDQILSLPPDTLICPGHGPLTTVAQEREHNPFF